MSGAARQDLRIRRIVRLSYIRRSGIRDFENDRTDLELIPGQENLVSPDRSPIHQGAVTAFQVADDEPPVATLQHAMASADLASRNAEIALAMTANECWKMANGQRRSRRLPFLHGELNFHAAFSLIGGEHHGQVSTASRGE